ncbi:MAG: lysophospholipid acyltransferase family protein [Burkholderiaceae bacterium]
MSASNAPSRQSAARPSMPRVLRLLGLAPLPIAHLFGACIGVIAWAFSASYRRKLDTNMAQAGYRPGAVRRQAIVQAGRMIAECPWVWTHHPRAVIRKVLLSSTEALEIAEQRGRGVLILTPHLGAFEVAARFYAARRPITVLYKPPKIDFVRRWLEAARSADGVTAVPPTIGGLRTMLRTLRRGDIVGLLPDQVPTEGDGEWANFFGKPAYTMTLPQRLTEMTGCTVVLATAERLSLGRGWRLHFEVLPDVPTPAVVNARFEGLIQRMPGQYLWGYNRYKLPPGVAAADAGMVVAEAQPDVVELTNEPDLRHKLPQQ